LNVAYYHHHVGSQDDFFEANLAPISGLKGGKTEEVNPQLPVTVLYAAIFFTMLALPFQASAQLLLMEENPVTTWDVIGIYKTPV